MEFRVVEIRKWQRKVELRKQEHNRNKKILIDNCEIGLAYDVVDYPQIVNIIEITTDIKDGREEDLMMKFIIADHRIPFYKLEILEYSHYWNHNYGDRSGVRKRGGRLYQVKIEINGTKLNFMQANHLKPGDLLGTSSPFSFVNMTVTNGELTFPITRPMGKEWKNHKDIGFAQQISKKDWMLMLRAIIGRAFDTIIQPNVNDVRNAIRKLKMERAQKQKQERREKELRIKGQCFTGNGKILNIVAIGSNLVFSGTQNGKPIFIVDSPKYGKALYIFQDRGQAFAWAERRTPCETAERARKFATIYLYHAGNWKSRADDTIGK